MLKIYFLQEKRITWVCQGRRWYRTGYRLSCPPFQQSISFGWTKKLHVSYLNIFYFHFHIYIVHYTFQLLNCFVSQYFLYYLFHGFIESWLTVFCYVFLQFSVIWIFIFIYSESSQFCGKITQYTLIIGVLQKININIQENIFIYLFPNFDLL